MATPIRLESDWHETRSHFRTVSKEDFAFNLPRSIKLDKDIAASAFRVKRIESEFCGSFGKRGSQEDSRNGSNEKELRHGQIVASLMKKR